MVARALMFYMSILCDKTFCGYQHFYPVTLTLEFDLIFGNFNLADNIRTVSARALIFHMSNPCDKTRPWVPMLLTCDLGV